MEQNKPKHHPFADLIREFYDKQFLQISQEKLNNSIKVAR